MRAHRYMCVLETEHVQFMYMYHVKCLCLDKNGEKNPQLIQITVLEPDFKCIRLSILIYGNLQMNAAETVQVIQNCTCIY